MSHHESGAGKEEYSTPRWVKICGTLFVLVLLAFVLIHVTGHGLGGHFHHGMGQKP